jgi:hypothetical protein
MKRSRRFSPTEESGFAGTDFSKRTAGDLRMRRSMLFVALITLFSNNFAAAQETTNPIHYTWIVSSCETWNCAASALIMANGEPNVIVLPTTVEETPWLILRRVEEGSLYIPETEPFGCEVFDHVNDATTRFTSMDGCRKPLVLTVPDGRSLVVSLNQCSGARRRAVH